MKIINFRKVLKLTFLFIASLISILAFSIPISNWTETLENLPINNKKPYAITNVNILSFDNAYNSTENNLLFDQTVLIENGIITSIESTSSNLSSDVKTIDGTGKFLMPGLVDMHTHIFDKSDLTLYLSCGVTTVRNMMGFPKHLKWKKQVQEGKILGASIITGTPTLNSGNNMGPFHKKVKSPEKAKKIIQDLAKDGYDFVKIYDGLDKSTLDEIMIEANKHNLNVVGHIPSAIDFDSLLNKKILSIEHVEEILQDVLNNSYKEEEMRKVAQKIKQKNIYVTPTLSAYYHILQSTIRKEAFLERDSIEYINPFIRFVGRKQLKSWVEIKNNSKVQLKFKILQYITKVLNEEGVDLLLGTDCGPNLTIPGFTLIDEIKLGLKSGLSSFDLLRSGTYNAAKALNNENSYGSVSIGKQADLILLNENPLKNISTLELPNLVIKNGIAYDEKDIMEMREMGKEHISALRTISWLLF